MYRTISLTCTTLPRFFKGHRFRHHKPTAAPGGGPGGILEALEKKREMEEEEKEESGASWAKAHRDWEGGHA
jgi:hypothetical protein